jgi:hypothetical protein
LRPFSAAREVLTRRQCTKVMPALTFSTVYIRNLNDLNNSSAKNVLQTAVRIALSYAPRSGLSINRGMSAVRCATNREARDAPNDWPVFRTDHCSKPRPRLPIFAAGRLETSQWCDAIRPLRFMMPGEAGFTGSTAGLQTVRRGVHLRSRKDGCPSIPAAGCECSAIDPGAL